MPERVAYASYKPSREILAHHIYFEPQKDAATEPTDSEKFTRRVHSF